MISQSAAHSFGPPASIPKEYYAPDSVSLLLYDLMASLSTATLEGDIEFYASLAAKESAAILELGTGTGRVALALAAKGFSVIGIDRSFDMLSQAKRKLDSAGLSDKNAVAFICADMTRFALGRQFDLVISPFYSFSHLLSTEDRFAALKCIRAHVAPTGAVILHLASAQVLSANLDQKELSRQRLTIQASASTPGIEAHVAHRAVDRQQRICNQYIEYAITTPDGRRHTSTEAMRYGWMDEAELAGLLRAAGFVLIERRTSFLHSPGIEDILVLAPLHDG